MSPAPLYSAKRRRISLTPLIDVVFILLLFFMLSSSFVRWERVDLGAGANASAAAVGSPPVIIRLLASGELELDGRRLQQHELNLGELSDRHGALLQREVVVVADAACRVQQIVSGMERLQQLGVQRLTLGTPPATAP